MRAWGSEMEMESTKKQRKESETQMKCVIRWVGPLWRQWRTGKQ